jgi:cytochrome c
MQRLSSDHCSNSYASGRLINRGQSFLRASIVGLAVMMCTLPSPILSQEASNQAFNNACRTCHSTKDGDNRLGPNLHGILGRKAGSLPGYNYSSAMKGAGFDWNEEKLDRFMAHPDEVVPGNNMKPFGGVASADDRAQIIAFLRSTGRP